MTCNSCGKQFNDEEGGFLVCEHFKDGHTQEHDICSVSCLTELAWRLREIQDKMSKSKGSNDAN